MKLIIDIPKEDYEYIKNSNDMNFNAIKNGIALEDIKAELYNKSFAYSITDNFENDIVISVIKISDMEKIIDKHIKENKQ